MKYPALTSPDASVYLVSIRAGVDAGVEHLVKLRGEGKELNLDFVEGLREEFDALRAEFPDGIKNAEQGNRFEARAARIVHEGVPAHTNMLADVDFWTWLAVAHFRDVVEWRYGNPKEGAGLGNYGIGTRRENLLYRSWLRGEIVLDEHAPDRYHLCDAGQIDFYRSHLFRPNYGNARNFARALIRFQYPHKDRSLPNLKTLQIRSVAKRLSRLRVNLFLEILEESECRKVIETEAGAVAAAE